VTATLEARVAMLLTVGNATLDAQPQVVVMTNSHEEDTKNHYCQKKSYHYTISSNSIRVLTPAPIHFLKRRNASSIEQVE
jgi:hypothetical protein